jgi:hypothetical protein
VTSWPVAAPLHGRSLLCSQLARYDPFQAPGAPVTPQVHYTEGAPSPLAVLTVRRGFARKRKFGGGVAPTTPAFAQYPMREMR